MEIILNQADLEQIDRIIQKTPFEFAYPLFIFIRNKITEEQSKAQTKLPETKSKKNESAITEKY